MRAYELLTEARGLFARSAGEQYKDDQGTEFSFEKIEKFPESGRYETADEMQQALDDVTSQYNDLISVNSQQKNHGAFAIASFNSDSNKTLHYIKYFDQIVGNMFGKWDNQQIPGLTYQSKASKKAFVGFKPQQLFKSRSTFQSGNDLVENLTSNPTLNDNIKDGIIELEGGKLPTFKSERPNLEAIRDYLGEVLQAAAITTHPELLSGQLEDARKLVMGGADWTACSITFPMSQTSNLVDSYITAPSGEQIGVSSKGGSGAKASAKNLYDELQKMDPANKKKLESKYKSVFDIIEMIAKSMAIDGPLKLGVRLNLLSEENTIEIKKHIQNSELNIDNLSPWAKEYIKLYGMKEPKGWNYGYWLLANLAKECAKQVNSNPKFGQGCLAILNNSSLVQVYTSVSVKGNDVSISNLRAVYPPKFDGTVSLDGAKMYNSRGIIGRFGFSVD